MPYLKDTCIEGRKGKKVRNWSAIGGGTHGPLIKRSLCIPSPTLSNVPTTSLLTPHRVSRVPVGGAQPGSPHECREWLARAARGAQVLEGCSWQPFHLGPPPAARPAATSGMKGENYANVRLTPDPQKLHSFRRFAS